MNHIIWSDTYFWSLEEEKFFMEDIKSEYEEYADSDEHTLYYIMQEVNNDYLDDECCNLDIELENEIVVLGDLGLWDGRVKGVKPLKSNNIQDCLRSECDYNKWYCDRYNFKCIGVHHDGTDRYTYRVFRKGITPEQKEKFYDAVYFGKCTDRMVRRYTKSIRPYIAKVYGW